jgi:hypothetical protein
MKSILMKIIFFILPIILIITIVALLCLIYNSKTPEQSPGIFINNNIQNEFNRPIIIIKDTRRNLQWDAIEYRQALVIIPGTEKPIKTSP